MNRACFALAFFFLLVGCGAKGGTLPYSHAHDDSAVLQTKGHIGIADIVISEDRDSACVIGAVSAASGAFDTVNYIADPHWRSLEYLPLGRDRTCRLRRVATSSKGAMLFADSRLVVAIVPTNDAAGEQYRVLEVTRFDGGVPSAVDTARYACGAAVKVTGEYVQDHLEESAVHALVDLERLKAEGAPEELLRQLNATPRAPAGERDCWSHF